MRNYLLYKDMFEGTQNHNVYSEKVEKYINQVKDTVPPELLKILNSFKMNLGEFSVRFYDFKKQDFRTEVFEQHLHEFCIYIETIEIMNEYYRSKQNEQKKESEKPADSQ